MNARGLLAAALLCAAWSGAACRASGADEALPFELALEFVGEETVDETRLGEIVRAELRRLEVVAPDKAAVDDAAFALEVFYRTRGHADVRVDYDFEPEPPRASFAIHEGPQVRVETFELVGVEAIPLATVRARFGELARGGVYDEEQLKRARDGLRVFYREQGYLRVEIGPPDVVLDETHTRATVSIAVREGPKFVVRAVEFTGSAPELVARETALARRYVGDSGAEVPFLPGIVPTLENELREVYHRLAYPDVSLQVRPEFDEATGDVRIRVYVTPGDRVRVAHFRLEGNQRTKDAAILGIIDIDLGSLYDAERVREAFRDLYATGLFESIALRLEGTEPERTLVVEVVEARSVEISIEPGWGSYEGPRVQLGIEENNFQGRGQNIALEGTASLKAQSASVAWIDRDFLGSHFTSETTFFVEQREEPSFSFTRRGFGFFLLRTWTRVWSSSLGYEYKPTNVTDDPSVPLSPDVDSNTNVATLSTGLVYDDRDSLLLPTRGRRGLARFEWADDGFASDTEFLRMRLEYVQLVPAGRSVIALGARTGVISPFGKTDEIPLPERFFNGGENSVRSFEEDELLPEGVFGEPVGGESATTLNVELRREIVGNLAAALFYDYGNVTADVDDYLDFDGFRSGVGLGLRYQLPIGPVRLDLGWNPDAISDDPATVPLDEEEDEYVLHFSVGFPF